MLEPVFDAIDLLRKVSARNKIDKVTTDTIDAVATTLRLLNSSHLPPNSKIFDKLVSTVRGPLLRLYLAFPVEALQLSVTIFAFIFDERILPQFTAGDKAQQSSWGKVAESLLSGVLDYLDSRSNAHAFETVASALYPSLCRICFSPAFASSIAGETSGLKGTAFMLLFESANHMANRTKLRNPELLGGRRIGSALYGSKEYIVIENLLFLISRLASLPTPEAKAQRTSFLHDIFTFHSPKDSQCASELIQLFSPSAKIESDSMLSRSFDILAESNILYPQPFTVDKVDACNVIFPQSPPHERLFVDYKSFFANISQDDNYETFRVPFVTVHEIIIIPRLDTKFTRVSVHTTSPPQFGASPIKLQKSQPLVTVFDILQNDVERFMKALDARALTELVKYNQSQKSQPRIAVGRTTPLVFGTDSNPLPDEPSYREKVTSIGRAMGLDGSNDDSSDTDDLVQQSAHLVQVPPSLLDKNNQDTAPARSRLENDRICSLGSKPYLMPSPAIKPVFISPAKSTLTPIMVPSQNLPATPRTPSPVKIVQKSVFGYNGDELSEISDEADSLKALSQRQRRKKNTSISRTKAIIRVEKASVAVDEKRRRVTDSDDEVHNQNKSSSKVVKKKVAQMNDCEEDAEDAEIPTDITKISKAVSATRISGIQERVGASIVAQIRQTPSRAESLSQVSSPIDHTDDELESKEPKSCRSRTVIPSTMEKAVPTKSRRSVVKSERITKPKQAPAPPISKKRKRNEDESVDRTCDPENDMHKAKRLFSKSLKENKLDTEHPTDSQVLRKPPRPVANNYGNRARKGRASSPVASSRAELDVDYDAVPATPGNVSAKVLDTGKHTSGVVTRTRAAAMKNKNNQPASIKVIKRTTSKPKKTKTEHLEAPIQNKTTTTIGEEKAKQTETEISSETNTPDQSSEQELKKSVALGDIKLSKKQKEAPWEVADFLKNAPAVSEPDIDSAIFTDEACYSPVNESVTIVGAAVQEDTRSGADRSLLDNSTIASALNKEKLAVDKPTRIPVDYSSKNAGRVFQSPEDPLIVAARQNSAIEARTRTESRAMETRQNTKLPRSISVSGPESKSIKSAEKSNEIMSPVPRFRSKPEPVLDVDSSAKNLPTEVVMIDLTQDESPQKKTLSRRLRSSPKKINHRVLTANPDHYKLPPLPDQHVQQSVARTINKVTFAPVVKEESVAINEFQGGTKNLFSMTRSKLIASVDTPKARRLAREIAEEAEIQEEANVSYDDSRRDMQGIVDVLNEIQEVIIQKISGRFEQADNRAMICQSRLLQLAVSDLQHMHVESTGHFNRLIDLEAEYATRGRQLSEACEENVDINREICQYIRQKFEEHDRKSLAKKMPRTLTSRPLPDILQRYRSGSKA